MKPVKIGLLGLGTVGSGTVQILQRNTKEIAGRTGRAIEILLIAVRDINRPRSIDTRSIELTQDPYAVVNHPDIDIVVELIGGDTFAKDLVMKAIANGKHVITANKALIANYGNEIFEQAQQQGVVVAFEAAVAGGIPIIKALREGLAANQIEWLAGIINGTSNFILTEMKEKGREFADVLAEAQQLGYAEADPTFDVEGVDAAHKLAILTSIAFGVTLKFDKVAMEGITDITPLDVSYAEQLGYHIKHLGFARKTQQGIEMRVHPTLIPRQRLIANVDGVMNAILVKGDAVGPTLYYGAGAGGKATGSAVVADLIDVVRTLTSDPDNRVPHLAFQADALVDLPILPLTQIETAYYLRLSLLDKAGVLAEITQILGQHHISIEAVIQKEPSNENTPAVTMIMLTHKVIEQHMNQAIVAMERLDSVMAKVVKIRLEHLNK